MKSLSFCFSTAFAEFHNPTNYKFVAKWGRAGEDNRQYLRPRDLDFSQYEQKLFAINREGNRLQAFYKTGTLLNSVKMGQTASQFHLHYGIYVDAKGDIWIADSANDRVQKFDSNGNFLKFGNEDSKCSSEFGKFDNLLKNRKMDRNAHKN